MKLYVEGGGESKTLKTACRAGFSEFLRKTGIEKNPRIVACGSRQSAYGDFSTAIAAGEVALLLVDSEAPVGTACQNGDVSQWTPWEHLKKRQGDKWTKPEKAEEDDCHLMVQCMEAWLLADRKTLQAFFGQGFNANALPAEGRPIESVDKEQLYESLANATKSCKTKAAYGKGEHSFKLLALVSPDRVTASSPWAKRFVDIVRQKMEA